MAGGTHRRGRWFAGGLALLVAALVATGLHHGAGARATASVQRAPGGVAAREQAVQALLDRRAEAVLQHDERAFLADVDPTNEGFLARQRATYRGLARVPFEAFAYRLLPGRTFTVAEVTRRWGADATVVAVVATHRLQGFDSGDVAEPLGLTVAFRDGRWLLESDDDVDASLPAGGHAAPWDVGEVAVASGEHSLVIGDSRDADELKAVATRVDRAVGAVSELWPVGASRWPGKVVVYTSRDAEVMETYLDATDDPGARPAAIALPVYDAFSWFTSLTTAPERVGARVVVDGAASNADDDVLLRHEITHVATMDHEAAGTPSWMTEGIADYTALRPGDLGEVLDGVGVDDATADALDDGSYTLDLPYSVRFYGDADTVEANYTTSLLVCTYVAERWGEQRLMRLHSVLGEADDPLEEPDAVERAVRSVLHVSTAQLEHDAGRAVQQAWDG